MREYIRHPSDIPIKYHVQGLDSKILETLNNVSEGGLCFRSMDAIKHNTSIIINIPIINPIFHLQGVVVWCQPSEGAFDVGMKFMDKESLFY